MKPLPTEESPWTTLSSDLKYDNPWIRVVEHRVIHRIGGPKIYGTIHFKHLAVGVIPLDNAGNIWLVGQYRYPLHRYSWEIPEGGGPADEEPLATAKRELKEEAGLTANVWEPLVEMDLSNSTSDERGIVFLASGLSRGESEPDDDEALSVIQIPFEEAYARVLRGELRDSLTVAGILRLKCKLSGLG